MKQEIDLKKLKKRWLEKWPSAVVARPEVKAFSGGIISGNYLANIDSDPNQIGPPRIRCGLKTVYDAESLVDWLIARVKM